MASHESFEQLDCRGMQCPAPILQTARAARALRGKNAVIEILADDAAFPEDIKSWCTSARATLLALDQHNGTFQAKVQLAGAPAKDTASPTTANTPTTQPQTPSTLKADIKQLDCRGMQCPAPILQIAKAARTMQPGQQIEMLADDDAFPEDIKSWCSSSNATLLDLSSSGGVWRALIQRGGAAPKPSPAPAQPVATLATAPTAVPVQPPPPAVAQSTASPALRVSLRDLDEQAAMSRLDTIVHAYEPGERVALESHDESFAKLCVSWLSARSHTLEQLDTRQRPARAEFIIGAQSAHVATMSDALVRVEEPQQKRCTLLILRNDFEALMAALLVANGAAAQGMEVTIFFSFWGLNLLRGDTLERELEVSKRGWFGRMLDKLMPSRRQRGPSNASLAQRMFKMMMPSGPRTQALGKLNFGGMGALMLQRIMNEQKIMSMPEMLAAAVEQDVRFIVCTMSMGVMGIAKDDLMPLPNMIFGGVATFVEDASRAEMSMVF